MRYSPSSCLSRGRFVTLGAGALGAGLAGCGGGSGTTYIPPSSTQSKAVNAPPTATPTGEASASAAPTVAATTTNTTITIAQAMTGALMPAAAGLSYEKSNISNENSFTPGNTGLAGCFARLGKSVLRIGGNSVDETTWSLTNPGKTSGQVAPADVSAFAEFIQSIGWQVIYGINLANNTPQNAASEAAYAASVLGSNLANFEIGNEPENYVSAGYRPAGYSFSDFSSEWLEYADAIRQVVPGAPLSGPASGNIFGYTVPFASSNGSQIDLLTQHYYRTGSGPASTAALLLAPDQALVNGDYNLEKAVTANNISGGYRFGEANSFYGGGEAGVSNAYASALWAIDFLLITSQNGAAGVNFHGGGNPYYTPIADASGMVTEIRPIYYGLLFVSLIAPGKMYQLSVASPLLLTAYAVAGQDGSTYVVVVNKDPSNTAQATITLPNAATSASILALTGQGIAATTGTLLGGSAVGLNGSWSPQPNATVSIKGSTLDYAVPPACAALFKIT